MKAFIYSSLMIVLITSCQTTEPEEPTKTSEKTEVNEPISWIIPTGKTVETRFNTPRRIYANCNGWQFIWIVFKKSTT